MRGVLARHAPQLLTRYATAHCSRVMSTDRNPSNAKALLLTRRWVERVVVGLSLCPWAEPLLSSGGIRYALTDAATREGVFSSLLDELDILSSAVSPPETTIIVAPHAFADDFIEFYSLVSDMEAYLQEVSLDEEFQVLTHSIIYAAPIHFAITASLLTSSCDRSSPFIRSTCLVATILTNQVASLIAPLTRWSTS